MSKKTYRPIIGLEVHAELKTVSKMFCGCKNDPFGAAKPNSYTCPVCLGLPGALPLANKKAIDWTLKLGLALNCEINQFSKFDRKNYFYPDLAKGYQLSQYDLPFCYAGNIATSQGQIRIRRIHLEEDTGKLLHKTIKGEKVSLIDFNRSGVPLVEIVTEPDIINGEQAKEYGRKLRQIMRYLDIADCKMAEGGMRLEANISLLIYDGKARSWPNTVKIKIDPNKLPNYKVEVKNINSFRFLEQAINFEITRQKKLLDQGQTPAQETRGFNPDTGKTFSQRTKEEAADYRYFPDPDLPPIEIDETWLKKIQASLPELPAAKQARWIKDYQLETRYAQRLSQTKTKAQWAEQIFSLALKKKLKPNELAKDLVNKKIKAKVGDKPTAVITQYQKLHQTAKIDQAELASVVEQVIKANPQAVKKYQAGKKQVLGFLIGQTMQRLNKKIDAKMVKACLEKKLA